MEDKIYFKVIGHNNRFEDFQYQTGLNIAPDGFDDYPYTYYTDAYEGKGFYFATAEEIPSYYQCGDNLVIVNLPFDDDNLKIERKFMANKIIISKEIYPLSDINTYHQFGLPYPSLSLCAKRAYFSLVKFLVENGEDILNINEAIPGAVENGSLEIIKYLVDNGADLTIQDNNYLLYKCADLDRLDIIKYLVENGLNLHNTNSGSMNVFNVLHICALKNRLDIVKYLNDSGYKTECEFNKLLPCAMANCYYDFVIYLLVRGADINTNNGCLLRYAAMTGKMDAIKFLTENGADVNNGNALLSAIEYGKLDIIKFLVKMGADLDAIKDNALDPAVKKGHPDIVKFLVENGADIHANNDIALVSSIEYNYPNITKYLIENGANIDVLDDESKIKIDNLINNN